MKKQNIMDPSIHDKDKMYGTTVIGARGQVVIPVAARKDLGLEPGDRLLVMAKFGKVLGLMKASQIEEFISSMMSHITDKEFRKEFAKRSKDFLRTASDNL